MNITIYNTVRAGVVFGVALFSLANTAFAAPALTPVTVTDMTTDSAKIVGHVFNPYKNSTVWFEIFNNGGSPTTVAVQTLWHEGRFEWILRDLAPGQTYSYRSAAMENGTTIYSPTSSFTIPLTKPVAPITIALESNTISTTKTTVVKNTEVVTPKKEGTAPVVAIAPKEGFTNSNSAAIIGAGNGMLPATLIGWILLLIVTLVAVLVGHMILVSIERRKKPHHEDEVENETE